MRPTEEKGVGVVKFVLWRTVQSRSSSKSLILLKIDFHDHFLLLQKS